jgi:hypothetical protein
MNKQKIFILVFLVAFFSLVVWYIVTTPVNDTSITIDKLSTDRLSTLNRVLTSWLGRHWSIILASFAVLIFFLNLAIYFSINAMTINVSDTYAGLLSKTFAAFTILATVTVVGVASNNFLTAQTASNLPNMPNAYKPNQELNQNNKIIFEIAIVVFVILVILIAMATYLKIIK